MCGHKGKVLLVFILVIACVLFGGENCSAASDEEVQENNGDGTEDYSGYHYDIPDETYNDIYNSINLYKADSLLKQSGINNVSLADLFTGIKNGDMAYVRQCIFLIIRNVTIEDILLNKEFLLQLIIIALLGSIFVRLAGTFGNGFVGEQGFYVTYLMITSLLLSSFLTSLDTVSNAIDHIIDLVSIIVPVYALSMNFIGSNATSVGMYELIMLGIWLVQVVISGVVLPLIKFYVIVALINNINKEDSFSKLCKLIRNIVGWLLKTIIVFIAGLSLIKSLLEPQMDILGKHSLGRFISAIPGGGMGAVITGTFLKAGMVIKNSVGVTGIVIIGIVTLTPVIKTFLVMLMIRITAAMLQPIGEKRYVDGIESLAQGMSLLLQTIGSSAALFMLTIAIMAFASNGAV
ncbi:MAG: stage III sporulation protein AE [Clostridium sp.]|nr:stage III sporulation protein AE [Clostridium sp.]MCM1399432.1 stage III sporulation protein AE [Clostridium sp.]MCM1459986.1 stage III sporulation protein AE [Bacteroides sp.]